MLIRRIVVVLLLFVIAIVANSRSRLLLFAGGVHNWTEHRQLGWPCALCGYSVDVSADYGDPLFSQPTTYPWKIRPPTRIIWLGEPWLHNAISMRGILLTLGWWIALFWLVCSMTCGERWQFGTRQLLLLPVLIGSAFVLSKMI